MLVVQRHALDDFRFLRQFRGDLLFGAAQQEGPYPATESIRYFMVAVFLDGGAKEAAELFAVAQQAGQQKVEQ